MDRPCLLVPVSCIAAGLPPGPTPSARFGTVVEQLWRLRTTAGSAAACGMTAINAALSSHSHERLAIPFILLQGMPPGVKEDVRRCSGW